MINKVIFKNFLNYPEFKTPNLAPINVIIGKNDTGKTGLLKVLYGCSKALEGYSKKIKFQELNFKKELGEKLYDTFQPRKNGIGALVSKGQREMSNIEITFKDTAWRYNLNLNFSFGDGANKTLNHCTEDIHPVHDSFNALFIPAKEVLTAFNEIRITRDEFSMPGFDDTYLDLIKALTIPTQQGRIQSNLTSVNTKLESLFEGEVQQTGDKDQPFIFKKGKSEFSMQQTAEGIKKIGILTTLIRNKQIGKDTVLFMDEPETALHPSAIREMVEMLVEMSKAGVQIFLATHSYFVLKQLSIAAKREHFDILCVSLEKNSKEPITASFANLKNEFPSNSIIDEALSMYNDEIMIDLAN